MIRYRWTNLIFSYSSASLLITQAAATALLDQPTLSAEDICRKSMKIAADMCIYTNHDVNVLVLDGESANTTARDASEVKEASELKH